MPVVNNPDFAYRNEGSIVMLQPISDAAKDWADENLPEQRMVWGPHIVIEHRYFDDIAAGIDADGLVIAGN